MTGRVSGVATQLRRAELYPDLVVWHCCNHRVELAVGDTIKEIFGINHFQNLLDKLYALYHASPKKQRELHYWAEGLAIIFLTIGRVLGIQWVASSDRTVKAVWLLYLVLYAHFNAALADQSRQQRK
ncbi:hypothetical protein EOD39_14433 [Acipenser ruthenus]|uniref:Zinc finger protein 862 n=1 Tax=Acipenser ruthenus TaxID=7906 RepID=A0A444UFY6_ACIRT|nr:hypothetical protein EOD39_14433 [Acipenser ruthenus]